MSFTAAQYRRALQFFFNKKEALGLTGLRVTGVSN